MLHEKLKFITAETITSGFATTLLQSFDKWGWTAQEYLVDGS